LPNHDTASDSSPSEGLTIEVNLISNLMHQMAAEGYTKVHVIAKSLSSIVLSYLLEQQPEIKDQLSKLTILGMPIGDVKTAALKGVTVDVIQGSEDRYGNIQAVAEEFSQANLGPSRLVEISGGDHSYRDVDRRPAHQTEAIKSIKL
jgi:predicted alpha/beta-hydrolase family hydrolase